jgi:ferrous iron transport protein B
VELPPMRWPVLSNVVIKTVARIEWYLKEVVPLFLLGTALLFLLDRTGIRNQLSELVEPLVAGWLGLPPEASAAFLVGFLRRDFGATGLFIMESQGMLSPLQVVVAMVTITLFIPCIASVLMIAKERSWKTALSLVVLIIPLAFFIGGLLYRLLALVGWGI